MKKCPTCAEQVQDEAKVCRYCGHKFGFELPQLGCVGTAFVALAIMFVLSRCDGDKPATPPPVKVDVNRAQAYQSIPTETAPGAKTGPAPKGFPKIVAKNEIDKAGHECGEVNDAIRIPPDGSIIATCSNAKRYRIFRIREAGVVAMNCEAATKLIGTDACQIP